MKAHPILMSAPMVRALLEGRKTQTRRIVKPQPSDIAALGTVGVFDAKGYCPAGSGKLGYHFTHANGVRVVEYCPYGKPGDLLWVRETWALASRAIDISKVYYKAHENASHTEFHEFVPTSAIGNHEPTWPRFKPSIHMPRWASRLTLELTDVRVQRLQEISEKDAEAEGMERFGIGWRAWEGQPHVLHARHAYQDCWKAINGPGSWDANPWVWVLAVGVHRCNVDEFLKGRAA